MGADRILYVSKYLINGMIIEIIMPSMEILGYWKVILQKYYSCYKITCISVI